MEKTIYGSKTKTGEKIAKKDHRTVAYQGGCRNEIRTKSSRVPCHAIEATNNSFTPCEKPALQQRPTFGSFVAEIHEDDVTIDTGFRRK
jgi:hypothetical protein